MKDFVELGLPDKMNVEKTRSALIIRRKWFGFEAIFLTVFAVIWNGNIFSEFTSLNNLPLIYTIVGVGVSYFALTKLFNKTTIKISKLRVEVNHSPLPWFGNTIIKAPDIKQVYGKEKVSRNNNSSSVTYEVHIIAHKGKDTKILSGLCSSEQALYVEQEIEKYLTLENKPVRGELG